MPTNITVQYESRQQHLNDILRDTQRYHLAQVSQGAGPKSYHSPAFMLINLWQHLKHRITMPSTQASASHQRKRHA